MKSNVDFCFVTVSFWTDRDVRWPSFTVDVAVPIFWSACMYLAALQVTIRAQKKILISTIADPVNALAHCISINGIAKALYPITNVNLLHRKLCFGMIYVYGGRMT